MFIVSVNPKNKEIKVKKNFKEICLTSNTMLRKLRLGQKNGFPIEIRVVETVTFSDKKFYKQCF